MEGRLFLAAVLAVFMLVLMLPVPASAGEDIHRITKEALLKVLDSPELVVLDVRTGSDWDKSPRKVKGAVRVSPDNIASWAGNYEKSAWIVLYCA